MYLRDIDYDGTVSWCCVLNVHILIIDSVNKTHLGVGQMCRYVSIYVFDYATSAADDGVAKSDGGTTTAAFR